MKMMYFVNTCIQKTVKNDCIVWQGTLGCAGQQSWAYCTG